MSDEIKEILDDLRNKDCYVNDETILIFDEAKALLDYITNLQTIEREYSNLLSENAELQQENDRLNNIINELEKWAKSIQLTVYRSDDMPVYQHQDVLDKLKELKENK